MLNKIDRPFELDQSVMVISGNQIKLQSNVLLCLLRSMSLI